MNDLRHDAHSILNAALQAADASHAVQRHLAFSGGQLTCGSTQLPLRSFRRVHLLSVGKAAAAMAAAVTAVLPEPPFHTLVVTKTGHAGAPPSGWEVIEAGHPIPDSESLRAAIRIRHLLSGLTPEDLVILTVSGGASALLAAPESTITLEDKQRTTQLLLHAGADIHELNAVRKHLSFLKGGKLAALAAPATVLNLLLSDVVGDPPAVIGSGLAAPDTGTFSDALAILTKYHLDNRVPLTVRQHLVSGSQADIPETPKANDPVFRSVHTLVVGSNHLALQAAAAQAKILGYETLLHSSALVGETQTVAGQLTALLRSQVTRSRNLPLCILAGGETTVTVHGSGKGGRNQEFALAAALSITDLENVLVLSAGTDGTDGPTDAAGAIATTDTLARARAAGLSARDHLDRNDSYPFFEALGDLVKTGPTGTNVMDIQILLAQKN